jgi:hypothetical protein
MLLSLAAHLRQQMMGVYIHHHPILPPLFLEALEQQPSKDRKVPISAPNIIHIHMQDALQLLHIAPSAARTTLVVKNPEKRVAVHILSVARSSRT